MPSWLHLDYPLIRWKGQTRLRLAHPWNSPISILLDRYRDLGLDDGIDTSNLVGYLPSALEEERVIDRSRHCMSCIVLYCIRSRVEQGRVGFLVDKERTRATIAFLKYVESVGGMDTLLGLDVSLYARQSTNELDVSI